MGRAEYDLVVVGGATVGLAGAKIAARMRRTVLVVDRGRPRNAPAAGVHNYLYAEGASPDLLREIGRREVLAYGVEVVDAGATSASRLLDAPAGSPRFAVEVTGPTGRRWQVGARRLLLATGLSDQLPDLPGLAEHWGDGVVHCPFCHGWEVRDQPIGVIGTTTMGPVQVRLFRHLSGDVVYFQHTAPEPSAEQREEMAALGVRHVVGPVAQIESDPVTGALVGSACTTDKSSHAPPWSSRRPCTPIRTWSPTSGCS